MKVLLVVQREPDVDPWVEDALDEYTLESWNGKMPDSVMTKIERDPSNFRTLWVDIPDGALERLWDVPTVKGTVLDA